MSWRTVLHLWKKINAIEKGMVSQGFLSIGFLFVNIKEVLYGSKYYKQIHLL